MVLSLDNAVKYFLDKSLSEDMANECKRILFCVNTALRPPSREELFLGMPRDHYNKIGKRALDYLNANGYVANHRYHMAEFSMETFAS